MSVCSDSPTFYSDGSAANRRLVTPPPASQGSSPYLESTGTGTGSASATVAGSSWVASQRASRAYVQASATRLTGKVAVVTGGSGGLGSAICEVTM